MFTNPKHKRLFLNTCVVTLALSLIQVAPTWAQSDTSASALNTVPQLAAGPDGFVLKSPDNNFILKWKGLLQADFRGYFDENDTANEHSFLSKYPNNFPNTFLLRKVRPTLDATLWKYYNFRITPDFGGGTTVLLDAYGEVNFWPSLRLRVGKFTPSIALERIQASSDNVFAEYGPTAALAPQRDIGAQVFGDLMKGSLSYAVGIFNGAADGANKDNDSTDHKDITGRIFTLPFKNGKVDALRNLGVGFAANWGQFWGDSVNSNLSVYKTTGQNTYFSYRTGAKDSLSAHAFGNHYRLNPEGTWYVGSLGLLGEYIYESQNILINKTKSADLKNQAWLAMASYVVTGEQPSFTGIKPRHPLGPNGIGAIELVVRAGQLIFDNNSFPLYADSTKSAQRATSFGGGVNWYFSKGVKWTTDYELTVFKGGAVTGNRDNENVVISRLQLNF